MLYTADEKMKKIIIKNRGCTVVSTNGLFCNGSRSNLKPALHGMQTPRFVMSCDLWLFLVKQQFKSFASHVHCTYLKLIFTYLFSYVYLISYFFQYLYFDFSNKILFSCFSFYQNKVTENLRK